MYKKTLVIVGIFVLTVFVLLLAAPFFMDSSRLKPLFEQLALKQAGYDLKIGGEVNIRLLPSARVRLSDITLASTAMPEEPFVKVQSLDVGVRFFPLLRGAIEVKRLTFESPDIQLIKTQTSNNWSSNIIGVIQSTQVRKDPPQALTKEESALFNRHIMLLGFTINNGKASLVDKVAGTDLQLADINVDASASGVDKDLKLNGTLLWNQKPVTVKGMLTSVQSLVKNQEAFFSAALESEPLNLNVNGEIKQVSITGNISGNTPSALTVGPWLRGAPVELSSAPVALDVAAAVDCSFAKCGLEDMVTNINGTQIRGNIAMNLMETLPHVVADLQADRLDLSPFVESTAAGSSTPASTPATSAAAQPNRWNNDPIDLSLLRQFRANVSLRFKELIVGDFKTGAGIFRAKNDRTIASAELVDTALYDGKANIFVNLSSDRRVDGRMVVNNILAKPLLDAVVTNNRFSGTMNGQAAFASTLQSVQSLVENLAGNAIVNIRDGSVEGVDIAAMVRNIESAFKPVDRASQKTDFTEAGGTFILTNGVVKNDDLMIKAPLFRVSGKGSVDLPAYTINYRLIPELVETIQGQSGKAKQGLGVPILISGSLDNPSYAPDTRGIIKDAVKNPEKIKKTLKKVTDQIDSKKAKEAVGDLLKGF